MNHQSPTDQQSGSQQVLRSWVFLMTSVFNQLGLRVRGNGTGTPLLWRMRKPESSSCNNNEVYPWQSSAKVCLKSVMHNRCFYPCATDIFSLPNKLVHSFSNTIEAQQTPFGWAGTRVDTWSFSHQGTCPFGHKITGSSLDISRAVLEKTFRSCPSLHGCATCKTFCCVTFLVLWNVYCQSPCKTLDLGWSWTHVAPVPEVERLLALMQASDKHTFLGDVASLPRMSEKVNHS